MPSIHQPNFLWSQFFSKLPYPTKSYTGKTVIVTGSNVGLGKEAARHFARLGASTIILAVRSIEKGEAAKADIEKTTKISKDIMQVWQLDMASYASVKKFAERVNGLPRVDALVENAGIAALEKKIAEDNEATITVNVISTFLLAILAIPKLNETAEKFNTRPNLVIVSSDVHTWTQFKYKSEPKGKIFETINADDDISERYPTSKLLEVFVVRALTERFPAVTFPITVNYLTPGLCHSELARGAPFYFSILKFFLARTTEHGSRSLVYAASAGAETHGHYLYDCHIELPSPFVLSAEGRDAQERVWEELLQKLEKINPGISKLL